MQLYSATDFHNMAVAAAEAIAKKKREHLTAIIGEILADAVSSAQKGEMYHCFARENMDPELLGEITKELEALGFQVYDELGQYMLCW